MKKFRIISVAIVSFLLFTAVGVFGAAATPDAVT